MNKEIRFQFTINGKNYIFHKFRIAGQFIEELPLGTNYLPAGKELYSGKVTSFAFDESVNKLTTFVVNDYKYNEKKAQVTLEFIKEMMENADWRLLPDEPDDLDV